ncbi:putative low-specificity L-threonine aldolase 1, partial [Halocaridina rubra]
ESSCSQTVNTKIIDLRTDVLTKQSNEMMNFMMEAEVGDDVFEEDPTTIALQDKVSKLLGKEAALFVLSGTMGNLLCVMTHCNERDSEVILGDQSHIHIWEQGNIAQLGGIHSHTLATLQDGTFDLEEVKAAVRPYNVHLPVTKLVCIENTHNQLGGKILPLQWLDKVTPGQMDKTFLLRGLKAAAGLSRLLYHTATRSTPNDPFYSASSEIFI